MPEPLHNEEALFRYLDGEMSGEEKQLFEAELHRNATLSKELEQLQLAKEAVRQLGTAQKVGTIHREMMQALQEKQPKVAPVRRLVRRTLAVAASILVLLAAFGGWWLYQTNPDRIYQEHYVDFTLSQSRDTDVKKGIAQSYRQKDFQGVVQQSASATLSAQDSLMVGLSYQKLNQLSEATTWLKAISTSGSTYQQDAEYYLSFVYLKNKEYEKAYQLMQKISSNKNHLYHHQISKNLLRKVDFLD